MQNAIAVSLGVRQYVLSCLRVDTITHVGAYTTDTQYSIREAPTGIPPSGSPRLGLGKLLLCEAKI